MAGLVNTSLWTLKFEVLCYAGLALAGSAGLLASRARWIAAPALALFLLLVFVEDPASPAGYSSLDNIRYFALYFGTGVLAYMLRDRLPITALALPALFAVFVLLLGTPLGELGTALFLGYATLWVAVLPWGPLRDLTNRWDISFGVYIYAGPVQQLMIDVGLTSNPLLLSLAALSIVLPLALLSWTLVEQPSLALRHALHNRIAALLRFGRLAKEPGRD
jgi:peptidoglycan/LPS O-acetylase OafA/YrhL